MKACMEPIYVVPGGAIELASHVSEQKLLISGRWMDPGSLKSYVELPEETRLRMSGILDLNLHTPCEGNRSPNEKN